MKSLLLAATLAGIAIAGVILYLSRDNVTSGHLIDTDGQLLNY